MDPHAHILTLISKKLPVQPQKLLPKSLVKAFVELEEEGQKELAGFSNISTDQALVDIPDDDEPRCEKED